MNSIIEYMLKEEDGLAWGVGERGIGINFGSILHKFAIASYTIGPALQN